MVLQHLIENHSNVEVNNKIFLSFQEASPPNLKLKSINFHGALLLKTLFDFEDPSKLVKSLLTLSLEELLTLANDPMGSYAIEAFLKSRSVPLENKHMLIDNLKVKPLL